ncbi:hypothetical protein M408DRAFT_15260 [Serendipita vermifera MAFF 305830]|uniref:SWI/SNF and RSC complexes subunit Ssr4 N-terminal domain-containing protein n=1 Tax=Serendipita vermifera MAFF 305830 TaxID=933852 RepID=A0A0C2WX95_SERVB|nr:hypothetical protein M408DRAFT_15260 [Serendipita vermifera MAFF 305830]
MGDLRQPHPEALLLFPMEIPPTLQLGIELITTTLYRQMAMSVNVPYKWSFIDQPKDGEIYLVYHRGGPLTDGLMYLEQEHRSMVPKQGHSPDIECFEARQGFIPGQDNQAFRIRRRFHIVRPPGNHNLFLVHYSRSQQPVPVAAHLHQNIRNYPLPGLPHINIFVAGPRTGQMVHDDEARQLLADTQARAPEAFHHQQHPGAPGYAGVAQDLSAQTSIMRELERKKRAMAPPQARRDDEDSPDEDSAVSVRTLALSRYKRNHELMEEVFQRAAFGIRKADQPLEDSLPPLTLESINEKLAIAQKDVAELERKAAERQRIRDEKEQGADVMMVS